MKNLKLYIALLLSFTVFAQKNLIRGIVTSKDGGRVPFAVVKSESSSHFTLTDINGFFELEDVPSGEITIWISSLGYLPFQKSVVYEKDEIKTYVLMPDPKQLNEVVVTANKREEDVQKIPGSVSSINSKKLEQLQISNSVELGRIAPNFESLDEGTGLYSIYSVRGTVVEGSTSSVGFYYDDIPFFRGFSFPSYLSDIERIEFLKGSQGTLYGRSAIGGVINIISKQPTNEMKSFVKAGYGNLNQYEFQAGISTPLIKDKLFFRAGGATTGRDGWIENTFLKSTNLLGRKDYNGNLRLSYIPGSNFQIMLNSMVNYRKINGLALIGGIGITKQDLDDMVNSGSPYQLSHDTEGIQEVSTIGNALKLTYKNDKIKLKSITAQMFTSRRGRNDDFDYTERDEQSYGADIDINTFSEEIRIESNNKDSNLEWIGGLYLYYDKYYTNWITRKGLDFSDPKRKLPYVDNSASTTYNHGASVFGEGSYKMSERLKLTLGLRYELEYVGMKSDSFDKTRNFGALSPKINLSHQWDNIMVYGSYNVGYRPGGLNSGAKTEDKLTYDPEYSKNFEIGIKSNFWQNRVKLNIAGFYLSRIDQQVYASFDDKSMGVQNLGKSRAYGVELESEFLLAEGLNLNANLGYLDSKYTAAQYSGNRTVASPTLNGNMEASWSKKLNQDLKFNAVLDYQYRSDMYFDKANLLNQGNYAIINSRLSFEYKNLEWSFWAKNIANTVYLSYGYALMGGQGLSVMYGLPRTFGTSLSVRF